MKPFFFTPTSQYNLIQFPDREKRGIFKQIYAQVIFFLTEKERKQFLIRMIKKKKPLHQKSSLKIK